MAENIEKKPYAIQVSFVTTVELRRPPRNAAEALRLACKPVSEDASGAREVAYYAWEIVD